MEKEQQRDDFMQVYRGHYAAIAAYLFRRTGQVATAEDLAADVFLDAFRGFARYQDRGVSIRHWLYRIATHRAHRWAKRRKRECLVQLKSTASHTVVTTQEEQAEEIEEALTAMQALSTKHQTVLTLHYLEGLALEEIALILGSRLGTIKSRLSRARDSLRLEISRRTRT